MVARSCPDRGRQVIVTSRFWPKPIHPLMRAPTLVSLVSAPPHSHPARPNQATPSVHFPPTTVHTTGGTFCICLLLVFVDVHQFGLDSSFSPVTLARASESAPIPQFGPSVRVHSPLGDQTISRSKGASNETNDSDDASDLDDQYAELANWEAEVVIRGVGELTMDDVRVLCFRQNIKADDKSLVAHAVDGKKLLRFKNASTLMKLIGSTVFALCSLKPRDFCCISLHLHGIWFDDVQIRRRHVSAEDGASVGN
eukprot:m.218012 g.218012  ORF g.218012 m.218012 type:complete len:254 (-) comp54113_c0_seq42:605-1366(-)